MSEKSETTESRIQSLRGLRGWAMLLIVLWHLNAVFPGNLPRLGNLGVDLFLMLSGFLIARKCAGPSAPLGSFRSSAAYLFRKLKSSYFLYLVPAVPVFLLDVFAAPVKPSGPLWRLLSYGTLTQSWIPAPWIYWGVNGAGWFLPVVLFAYLMTPLVRKVVGRFGPLSVMIACLVLQVAAEAVAERFLSETLCDWVLYICPAYRLLDFTLGFCAWRLMNGSAPSAFRSLRTPGSRLLSLCFAALVAVIGVLLALQPEYLKYVAFHLPELWILMIVASEKSAVAVALNRNPVMTRLGDLSRIIFFTHVPVMRLTGIVWRRILGTDHAFLQWLVSLGVIILFAVAAEKIKKGHGFKNPRPRAS